MHPEWFFSLHYTGRKAEKLQSGSLSHDLVCRLFLDDLRELRAGSVKQEKITQMGDTVGLNHVLPMHNPSNSVGACKLLNSPSALTIVDVVATAQALFEGCAVAELRSNNHPSYAPPGNVRAHHTYGKIGSARTFFLIVRSIQSPHHI